MTVSISFSGPASPSLANKNTCQRTAQHYCIELGLLLHGVIPCLALELAHSHPLSWFLAAVSRLHPLLMNLCGQFASLHSPHIFRSSSYYSHSRRQSKKYADTQKRSLYFSAAWRWERHLLFYAQRLPSQSFLPLSAVCSVVCGRRHWAKTEKQVTGVNFVQC